MCHVQKGACRIPLHSHVSGLGQACEGAQRTRSRNFCLVVFVRSKIGDATDSIALDLHIGREHLADERGQSTELNNQDLILGCKIWSDNLVISSVLPTCDILLTARFPSAALAAR